MKLEKRIESLASGAVLTVLATDPMAEIDIPLYSRQRGHTCLLHRDGDVLRFEITKA